MSETTDLARLVVSLEARLDKYTKVMAKLAGDTDKTLGRVEKRFKEAESRIAQFGANINDRLTKALTIGAVSGFLVKVIKDVANLTDQSQKAGVSMANLQKLIFASSSSGVGADQLVTSMAQFNKKIGEAATKGSDLQKLFEANGLSIRDQNGRIKDTVTQLLMVADLVKNARTEQEAMTVATIAGGKGWADMVPFLKQGGDSILESMKGAVVLGDPLIKIFDDLDDKMSQLALNWEKGIAKQILSTVNELIRIADLLDRLQKAMGTSGDVLGGLASKLHPEQSTLHQIMERLGLISSPGQWPGRERVEAGAPPGNPTVFPQLPAIAPAEAVKQIKEATKATEEQTAAIKDMIDQMDFARDSTRGFFGDLIHGLKDGKTLTEALGDAFNNLADKMIDRTLDQLMDLLMGKSGGTDMGLLGQLLHLGGTTPGAVPGAAPGFAGNAMGSAGMFGQVLGGVSPLPAYPVDPVTGNPIGKIASGFGMGSAGMFGQQSVSPTKSDFGVFGPGAGAGPYPAYNDLIREAAGKYGLDPDLLAGLIKQESGFKNGITSPAGAQGLTQLVPGTAAGLGVTNPFDPRQSIMGGANYLRQQMDRFGNRDAALAAYNWGPGNVASNGMGNLPVETQGYVKNVNMYAEQFAQKFPAALNTVTTAVQAPAANFSTAFPAALSSVLQAIQPAASGLFSFLGGGNVSGGLFGGGRADGGPINPGSSYLVGEHGPEMVMPRIPGVVIPNGGGAGGGALAVHVTRSKLFEVEVARIAGRGDVRTLEIAKRHMPFHMARFQSLGTT